MAKSLEPAVLRILSIKTVIVGDGNREYRIEFLSINENSIFFHGHSYPHEKLAIDTIIKCNPEKIQEKKKIYSLSYLDMDLLAEGSFQTLPESNVAIPKLSELYSKIEDLGRDEEDRHRLYFFNNLTVLEKPFAPRDDRGYIDTTSTVVGDETGQVTLYEQYEGEFIRKLAIGDKIKVLGAYINDITNGEIHLFLDYAGSIIKI